MGRLNTDMSSSLQKRYNTVELTHRTIENSITNARITFQLFETTDSEEEKKLTEENDAISQEDQWAKSSRLVTEPEFRNRSGIYV